MIATRHLTLVIAALAAAACDQLREDPGSDFGVKVLSPTPLAALGQASVALDFAVSGCDAFQAALEAGVTSHAIDTAKKGDGSFSAAVPVEWLREEDGTCLDDARTPHASAARLVVTCADAGRSAAADVTVSYGTASVAYQAETNIRLPQSTVQHLFPSADPFLPYALSISPLEAAADLNPLTPMDFWLDGTEELTNPLARPRVAANGTSAFLSSGCFSPGACPQVAVSPGTTLAGELLEGTSLRDGRAGGTAWEVWVPSSVLDLIFMPDGALLVLSQANDGGDPFAAGGAAVTRVVPAQPTGFLGTAEVTVIGYFPGESARTRFSRAADGRLAFISFTLPPGGGQLSSVLHLTDGMTVENLSDPTPGLNLATGGTISLSGDGSLSINGGAQLSPDATALVAAGAQLGPPGGPFSLLPSADPPSSYANDGDTGGAAWPAGAVALWRGMSFTWRLGSDQDLGRVESFDLAPPHARRFLYDVHALPGGPKAAQLEGVTAVGDKLVLTTGSGVRVLGPDGTLVGGADPLPCGLSPTALAIPTGPSTFAVAAGNFVYVFDLAAPR